MKYLCAHSYVLSEGAHANNSEKVKPILSVQAKELLLAMVAAWLWGWKCWPTHCFNPDSDINTVTTVSGPGMTFSSHVDQCNHDVHVCGSE